MGYNKKLQLNRQMPDVFKTVKCEVCDRPIYECRNLLSDIYKSICHYEVLEQIGLCIKKRGYCNQLSLAYELGKFPLAINASRLGGDTFNHAAQLTAKEIMNALSQDKRFSKIEFLYGDLYATKRQLEEQGLLK